VIGQSVYDDGQVVPVGTLVIALPADEYSVQVVCFMVAQTLQKCCDITFQRHYETVPGPLLPTLSDHVKPLLKLNKNSTVSCVCGNEAYARILV